MSAPDGYEETLTVVKTVREFIDVAKAARPADARKIETLAREAMRALWRVYGLEDK